MKVVLPSLFLVAWFSFSHAFAQDEAPAARTQQGPVAAVDANYRLALSDQLAVSVFDEPELAVTRAIAGDGTIALPMIDQIKVVGMTTRQVETAVAKTYQDKRLLKNPQVTVIVANFAQKTVSILGQVFKPGPVVIPGGQARIELLTAIASAGGFKSAAKKGSVEITRKDREKPEVVDAFGGRKGKGAKVYLYPGDVVFVPQSIF